jgi:hypothetical protein
MINIPWQCPQVWCTTCRRQKPIHCICNRDPEPDQTVELFRSKYQMVGRTQRSMSLNDAAGCSSDAKCFQEVDVSLNMDRKSPTFTESWSERLHNPELAAKLSFLRDSSSEALVKKKVFKSVDQQHERAQKPQKKNN